MRKYRVAKYFAAYAFASMLTGCGYWVQVTTDVEYESIGIGARRGSLKHHSNYGNHTIGKYEHRTSTSCTASFLLSKWGEPDEQSTSGEAVAKWTYYDGMKWVGASPVVILPLPLFVPIGRERISFSIEGNDVIPVIHETTNRAVAYVPFLLENNIIVGRYDFPAGPDDCVFRSKMSPCGRLTSCSRRTP